MSKTWRKTIVLRILNFEILFSLKFLGHPNAQHSALDQQCQHTRPPPKSLSFSICTHGAKRSTGIFSTKHPVNLAKMHLGAWICSALSVMRQDVYSMVMILWCVRVRYVCMYISLPILVINSEFIRSMVSHNTGGYGWMCEYPFCPSHLFTGEALTKCLACRGWSVPCRTKIPWNFGFKAGKWWCSEGN